MNSTKRIIAGLFCVCLILMLLVSSAYIVHEMDHDCTGHLCPVCQMAALCTELVRTLGTALFILLALLSLLSARLVRQPHRSACLSASCTLVSRKIRLND